MMAWAVLLAGQAVTVADDLSHFDLAEVKGTADPCGAGVSPQDLATGDVVVCGRKKNMTIPVKAIDWSEKPLRTDVELLDGVTINSTAEERSLGPMRAPAAMVNLKIKF